MDFGRAEMKIHAAFPAPFAPRGSVAPAVAGMRAMTSRRQFLQTLAVASVAAGVGGVGGCSPQFNPLRPESSGAGPAALCMTSRRSATAAFCTPPICTRRRRRFITGSRASTWDLAAPAASRRIWLAKPRWRNTARRRTAPLRTQSPTWDLTNWRGFFGKTGGLAHLATLTEKLRGEFGREKTLHLDSGDLLQGSAVSLRSGGRDMIEAANLLGVDAFTGHWEFTYPEADLRRALSAFGGKFLAQNIFATEEAQFDGAEVFDEESGRVFPPHMISEVAGRRIAVIGQAFPFTPISNPRRFIPNWTFGLRVDELRALVESVRKREKPDLVILLSHNGTDLDLRMAADVSGVDFVLGRAHARRHSNPANAPQRPRNPGFDGRMLRKVRRLPGCEISPSAGGKSFNTGCCLFFPTGWRNRRKCRRWSRAIARLTRPNWTRFCAARGRRCIGAGISTAEWTR